MLLKSGGACAWRLWAAYKKMQKSRDFPFDRVKTRAYIRRPRRPLGTVLRAALLLWHDGSSRPRVLFDIVIRGRGTWAAARSPRPDASLDLKIELKSSRSSV